MMAAAFFRLEAARQAPKTLWILRTFEANLSVDFGDRQVLARTELEPLAQLFRNDHLKFWVHSDGLHRSGPANSYRYRNRRSIFISIIILYYGSVFRCGGGKGRIERALCRTVILSFARHVPSARVLLA